MKALAFRNRGETKDAYDLSYFARFYAGAPRAIAEALTSLLPEIEATRGIHCLREDFHAVDSLGPRRVAEFVHGAPNEETQADAWAAIGDLLDLLPG
jgi:hypothetical protein